MSPVSRIVPQLRPFETHAREMSNVPQSPEHYAGVAQNNPLALDDPKYAPVSNTLSTSLCGVVMIRQKKQHHRRSPTRMGFSVH